MPADACKKLPGFFGVAGFFQSARPPINPGVALFERGRQFVDGGEHFFPVTGSQGRPGIPRQDEILADGIGRRAERFARTREVSGRRLIQIEGSFETHPTPKQRTTCGGEPRTHAFGNFGCSLRVRRRKPQRRH